MVMQEFLTSRLTDEVTQTSAAIQRDASINPLATLFDGVGMPDLGNYVQTESVRYEESSSVPRYPIETGQDASNSTVSNPPVISLRGAVPSEAGGGSGAGEVADTLRTLLKDGEVVSIDTARGTYDTCVVSRFTERQSERTGVGLVFEVQLTQVVLGRASQRIADVENQVGDVLTDDAYDQLIGPVTDARLGVSEMVLTDRNVAIDLGYLTGSPPPTPSFAEELNDDAKSFVKRQIEALSNAGKEVPPYPLAFIRNLDATKLAKRIGAPLPDPTLGIPVAGVDMWRLNIDTANANQSWSFPIPRFGLNLEVDVRRDLASGEVRWFADTTVLVEGLAREDLRGVQTNGHRLTNGSFIKVYTESPRVLIGALMVIPIGDASSSLGRRVWGETHNLIFTSNLQYIIQQR